MNCGTKGEWLVFLTQKKRKVSGKMDHYHEFAWINLFL